MRDFESKSGGETSRSSTTSAAISNLVTFFKPRQLLLNSNTMKHQQLKTPSFSLTDEQRVVLFQSICQFFQHNGFSKSLKKFTKEAHIQKESWKDCLLNLEEMCYQFFKLGNDTKDQAPSQKGGGTNHIESVETIKKTKKNEGGEGMKSEGKLEDATIVDVKPKKKKKSKSVSESSGQIAEENHTKPSIEPEVVSLSVPNEPEKKSKDKKKKHKEESQEEKKAEAAVLTAGEVSEQADVSQDKKKEKSKNKKKKGDNKIEDSSVEDIEVGNDKKGSKKRKNSSSEENENVDIGKELLGDSKRRKTDTFDQSNGTVAPITPNGSSNGILEDDEGKVPQKEKSKERNGSAAPRSASASNAFRRVKEEEVEFVDERLQDNSYWAKDGADTGYGAKAQEVLGQVRGRGFRHEKTKKKRGSYRGGQIDLQSHSIKFNYDEDDE